MIDPPYEDAGEFSHLAAALEGAHRKWANGIYMLWYPIKDRTGPDLLARRLVRTGIRKILRAEFAWPADDASTRLAGSGLVIVNPPWILAAELETLLPALARALAAHRPGRSEVAWLAGEA
jgi:23S rRNA (adenine2030-N6)-methyltransferase